MLTESEKKTLSFIWKIGISAGENFFISLKKTLSTNSCQPKSMFLKNNSLRQALLSYIRLERKIGNLVKQFNFAQFKQDELDRLCNLLTESIKINEVSDLIGI